MMVLGLLFVTERYRSTARQDELYTPGRSAPGLIMTYKRGGESNYNALPSRALSELLHYPAGQVCATDEGGRGAGALGW
ncbi:hypothetical protein GCM10028824_42760 [Hymenobacter segetis]